MGNREARTEDQGPSFSDLEPPAQLETFPASSGQTRRAAGPGQDTWAQGQDSKNSSLPEAAPGALPPADPKKGTKPHIALGMETGTPGAFPETKLTPTLSSVIL